MTSTILSFFKLFGTRASRTNTNPNSRTVVSLWRRFFEIKQQEEESRLEDIARALEERGFNAAACAAIQSENVVRARVESLREHYRELMGRNGDSMRFQVISANSSSSNRNRPNETLLTSPNLHVAVPTSNRLDADYMYLAQ